MRQTFCKMLPLELVLVSVLVPVSLSVPASMPVPAPVSKIKFTLTKHIKKI